MERDRSMVENFQDEQETRGTGRLRFDPEKVFERIAQELDTLRGEGYLLAAAGLFIIWAGYAKTRGKIEEVIDGLLYRFRYH